MSSRKVTRSIIVGVAAIAVAGGSYGIVSATSSSSPAAASTSTSRSTAGGPASGGGGSNAGFFAAANDIVVLLNSDMRVEPDFLAPLLAGFTDDKVFAVSCQTGPSVSSTRSRSLRLNDTGEIMPRSSGRKRGSLS